MINKIFFVICIILFSQISFSQSKNVCDKWDVLDSLIVNSMIEPDDALELMITYEPEIRKYFRQKKGVQIS
ncbi:MAG: hypothetical protein LH629_10890, partial [Ignavibacteria bacterium]|nr:hypothetical protein [Ignavibacteria bacterium]